MNFHDYIPKAIVTASQLAHDDQVMHAKFGMLSEVGELADMLKKHHAAGRALDHVNGMEEVGDICWYVALFCDEQGIGGRRLDAMLQCEPLEMSLKEGVILLGGLIGALCIDETERGTSDNDVLRLVLPLLSCVVRHFGYTLDDSLDRNIQKLADRHKNGIFNPKNFEERDVAAERCILAQSIKAHPDTNN